MTGKLAAKPAQSKGFVVRAKLKRAGGSLTMLVPAPAREALNLQEGQEMQIAVREGKMIVEATRARPRYTLDALLAQCDTNTAPSEDLQAWIDAPPVGREIW